MRSWPPLGALLGVQVLVAMGKAALPANRAASSAATGISAFEGFQLNSPWVVNWVRNFPVTCPPASGPGLAFPTARTSAA